MNTVPAHLKRFWFDFLKTGFATNARLLLVVTAPVILAAQGSAAQPPTITVTGASQVTGSSVTINGTVNPNGLPATFHLQWGTTTAYDHIGQYGLLGPLDTPAAISAKMTGLSPNTLYHYQLVATNSAGKSSSSDMTVMSGEIPETPIVTVNAAADVTTTSATITGTVNPNGLSTAFYVLWGTTTTYNHNGFVVPVPTQNTPVPVSTAITGLTPNTTYRYQLVATNAAGNGYSVDMTLTTLDGPVPPPPPPTAITGGARNITGDSAEITGTVATTPSSGTAYYFRWGTSAAYANTTSLAQVGPDFVQTSVTEWLQGLSPGTTYHYQLVATNNGGISTGVDMTFTTLSGISIDGQLLIYTTNESTITIFAYRGTGGSVTIPDTIAGLPVTTIGSGAFSESSVTSVTIPNSVTSIQSGAFYYCARLASITIPGSVTNIGPDAFAFCGGLTNLTIGNGVLTLGAQAFAWCAGLTSVAIPDSVTRIEDGDLTKGGPAGLFAFCSLTNVTVGTGLTYLGTGAFSFCPNLRSVLFRGDAPTPGQFMSADDVFRWDDSTTVYYLPGTTGWGPTYAGRPTMLWNAQLQGGGASLGIQHGRFGFSISGTADIPVVIEASTDPAAAVWVPVQSCTLTNGIVYFSDPGCNNYPARFYRIRSP